MTWFHKTSDRSPKPGHGPNNIIIQMQLPTGQSWVLLEVKFSLN